jgi:hypothetical protein
MNETFIYESKDKKTQINVKFEHDTVWLTQQPIAELFGQTKQSIRLHIKTASKIRSYAPAEAVVRQSLTTTLDGKIQKTNSKILISSFQLDLK